MNHAHIGNFSLRQWRLDIDLTRASGGIDVVVKAALRHDLMAKPNLAIRLPSGAVRIVEARDEARFTVEPSLYFQQFGRSANAAARAMIVTRLLGTPGDAFDALTRTQAEIEAQICKVEREHASIVK